MGRRPHDRCGFECGQEPLQRPSADCAKQLCGEAQRVVFSSWLSAKDVSPMKTWCSETITMAEPEDDIPLSPRAVAWLEWLDNYVGKASTLKLLLPTNTPSSETSPGINKTGREWTGAHGMSALRTAYTTMPNTAQGATF